MAQPQISVFGQVTGIMKTEGDINILCIHLRLWTFSQWKSIKIISRMNLMST